MLQENIFSLENILQRSESHLYGILNEGQILKVRSVWFNNILVRNTTKENKRNKKKIQRLRQKHQRRRKRKHQ